ncbi:hypothetical protein HPP92_020808 [Vanilla planifolia]|uniref:Uncharacterized protein n=1 Tax=Vanilla planifolia TaxID=51239 RepID=A0A835UID9_VANPL|nr:hypothetical protein HPP92_020808 [Vanilla planifolia]
MESVVASPALATFDVDDWDENFINEVFQAELNLSSRNADSDLPMAWSSELPPPGNPTARYQTEKEALVPMHPLPPLAPQRWGLSPKGFDSDFSDICFSPPRELSQKFTENSEPSPMDDDCVTVDTRILVNGGCCRRSGINGRNDEAVLRLKKELEHLTKKFAHMEQDCFKLQKDRDKKNEQLKCAISQLESKDAEIDILKRENLEYSKQSLPQPSMTFDNKGKSTKRIETCFNKEKGFQADESAVSELKKRLLIDDKATTSCIAQKCSDPERDGELKHMKTRGIQTDVDEDSIDIIRKKRKLIEHEISSNLHMIWGSMHGKESGNDLVSKLLTTFSADFCALFRCTSTSSKSCLEGHATDSSYEICVYDGMQSIQSADAAKAYQFYQLLVKMHHELAPLQVVIDALLELCDLDSASVVHVSLRIMHAVLQHLCLGNSPSRRRNVLDGGSVGKNFAGRGKFMQETPILKFHCFQMVGTENDCSAFTSDLGHLCVSQSQDYDNTMTLPFESLLKVFEMMWKIILKKPEDYIQHEGLLIMCLILMECKPNVERDKFVSVNLLQALPPLLSKDAGVNVRMQAVRLLFLLLNSPKMLLMLCGGQVNVAQQVNSDDSPNSTSILQREINQIIENLAYCLNGSTICAEELKLRRRVIILLAFVASSGRAGFDVLLSPVSSQKMNFLELIIQVLAFEMDAEMPDNAATQDSCKERISLVREALILLNRLASHPNYSEATLRVLTGSKATASLTIDVANWLSRKIQGCSKQNARKVTEIIDLARLFRIRVFTFLGVHTP